MNSATGIHQCLRVRSGVVFLVQLRAAVATQAVVGIVGHLVRVVADRLAALGTGELVGTGAVVAVAGAVGGSAE